MAATEQSICKKYWQRGVENYRAIAKINQWLRDHPKTIAAPRLILEEFVIPQVNKTTLEKLLPQQKA